MLMSCLEWYKPGGAPFVRTSPDHTQPGVIERIYHRMSDQVGPSRPRPSSYKSTWIKPSSRSHLPRFRVCLWARWQSAPETTAQSLIELNLSYDGDGGASGDENGGGGLSCESADSATTIRTRAGPNSLPGRCGKILSRYQTSRKR